MRTGIRSGIAARQIAHVRGATKNGTLCGRKVARSGFRCPTLDDARRLATQAVDVCKVCERKAKAT